MSTQSDLTIKQGKTFRHVIRWETTPIVYKAISAISKSAPVSLAVTGHGMPDGWNAAIVSVQGMTQINAQNTPPKESDYHKSTVIDGNTIEFNDINAADYSTYRSGGYLQYNTPKDLAGYSARMSIKTKVGGTELESFNSTAEDIVIDNTDKTITILISATDTAAMTWTNGEYELEMVDANGEVTQLLTGRVTVEREITN